MFKTKDQQRKNLNFTVKQIQEDIENVRHDADQCNLLYTCLDDRAPSTEKKFLQVQQFLKGSDDLEESAAALQEVTDKLRELQKELLQRKCETERINPVK